MKENCLKGKFGGSSFFGPKPKGVSAEGPLPRGTVFPNAAAAAVLLTFDVEGCYGNGRGDVRKEIGNYKIICSKLKQNQINATFNIVGKMAAEHGKKFVPEILDSSSEIASHGYVHDMNKFYGGKLIYAGNYGYAENYEQIQKGISLLNKISDAKVQGIRMPYGHFNEYIYKAVQDTALKWTSNIGADDFICAENGFGWQPFRIKLGNRIYDIVEIPLDSQTFDWAVLMSDSQKDKNTVKAVKNYCNSRGIDFNQSPKAALAIWQQRVRDAIEQKSVFTALCHPINFTLCDRALEDFIIPFIELLGDYQKNKKIWVCTCGQMADFYRNL